VRPTARPYDPEDVSETILQVPNNQQFRLPQGVFPSCWASKHLPPSLGPYYSVSDKVKACGQKAIPSSPIASPPQLALPVPQSCAAPGSGSCSSICSLYGGVSGVSLTQRFPRPPGHQPVPRAARGAAGVPEEAARSPASVLQGKRAHLSQQGSVPEEARVHMPGAHCCCPPAPVLPVTPVPEALGLSIPHPPAAWRRDDAGRSV